MCYTVYKRKQRQFCVTRIFGKSVLDPLSKYYYIAKYIFIAREGQSDVVAIKFKTVGDNQFSH